MKITYGYCHCGCGGKTRLAPHSRSARGWIKGQPVRFLVGHAARRWNLSDYAVEDRGFKTPCWVWRGIGHTDGYGVVTHRGEKQLAHRVMYERLRGPIPADRELDHLCRNRICCNPDHLEPVTRAVNTRRGATSFLSEADVFAIRLASLSTSLTQVSLAEMFAIHRQTVSRIYLGRSRTQEYRHEESSESSLIPT